MTFDSLMYYWSFARGIRRAPVESPHKKPVIYSALMFSLLDQAVEQ